MRIVAITFCLLCGWMWGNGQGMAEKFERSGQRMQGVQATCQPQGITTYSWDNGQSVWEESILTAIAYNDSGWPLPEPKRVHEHSGQLRRRRRHAEDRPVEGDRAEPHEARRRGGVELDVVTVDPGAGGKRAERQWLGRDEGDGPGYC